MVKPNSRHNCNIAEFSGNTSPTSPIDAALPRQLDQTCHQQMAKPVPFQSLRTAMANSAARLSGSAENRASPSRRFAGALGG
jgi:hypothetical protein